MASKPKLILPTNEIMVDDSNQTFNFEESVELIEVVVFDHDRIASGVPGISTSDVDQNVRSENEVEEHLTEQINESCSELDFSVRSLDSIGDFDCSVDQIELIEVEEEWVEGPEAGFQENDTEGSISVELKGNPKINKKGSERKRRAKSQNFNTNLLAIKNELRRFDINQNNFIYDYEL